MSVYYVQIYIMHKERLIDIAQEATTAYVPQSSTVNIEMILGSVDMYAVPGGLDKIAIARGGVSRQSLDRVAAYLGISLEGLSLLLHISYRTILRKKKDDFMGVYISQQVLALAEVVSKGIEVMESEEDFKTWIHSELPGLEGKRPLDYLDTSFGATMLLKILGRIEHGVY